MGPQFTPLVSLLQGRWRAGHTQWSQRNSVPTRCPLSPARPDNTTGSNIGSVGFFPGLRVRRQEALGQLNLLARLEGGQAAVWAARAAKRVAERAAAAAARLRVVQHLLRQLHGRRARSLRLGAAARAVLASLAAGADLAVALLGCGGVE